MMSTRFEDNLREALRVEAADEVRKSVRERVMAGAEAILQEREATDGKSLWRRQAPWRALRPIALAPAAFVLLFAGTALATTQATPDSFLYPLRQPLESARTALALQNLDKAHAEAAHANARLDEISQMASKGKPQYIPDLLRRYDLHINTATSLADAAGAEGEDTAVINGLIAASRARHDELIKSLAEMDMLPEEFKEAAPEEAKEDSSVSTVSSNGTGGAGLPAGGAVGGSGVAGSQIPNSDDSSLDDSGAGNDDDRGQAQRGSHSGGGDQSHNGSDSDTPEHPSTPSPSQNNDQDNPGHDSDSDSDSESHSESSESDLHKNQEKPGQGHREKA